MNADLDRAACWRALEALRSGVPNSDAVSVLGCSQEVAQRRFEDQLSQVAVQRAYGVQPRGILLAGAFGAGKSHVLEYFEHLALQQNFVSSRLVVSKETPLFDPAKMFRAAVLTAQAPGLRGAAVAEVAHRLDRSSPGYEEFYAWAHKPESGLGQMFPATLFIHEKLKGDPDLIARIHDYWAGDPLSVAEVRRGLRDCGGNLDYSVKAIPAKQLARQRFRFLSRMFAAAGYDGWVILVDEVELIGRYSMLQRGRAYAELAKWMGQVDSEMIPGVLGVGAITDDFALAVLEEKQDADQIVPKLRSKGTDEYDAIASRAETGMRIIARESLPLAAPDQATLRSTYEQLKAIHATAYQWSPPDIATAEITTTRRMRSFVRRWISEWDIARLYPGQQAQLEEEIVTQEYSEDQELSTEPVADDGPAGDTEPALGSPGAEPAPETRW